MATRDQIVTANRATFDAWNAHDPDAVAAVFAEDAVIRDVGSPEPVRGRAAIRDRVADLIARVPGPASCASSTWWWGRTRTPTAGSSPAPTAASSSAWRPPGARSRSRAPPSAASTQHGLVVEDVNFWDVPALLGAAERLTLAAMDPLSLPPDLPVPEDDGGGAAPARDARCRRSPCRPRPASDVALARPRWLDGRVRLPAHRPSRRGAARGGEEAWNAIPGARGCTPELCGVRDDHAALEALGARVFGLSTQDTDYQREVAERLGLRYPLLSDEALRLTRALRLPTFEVDGLTLMRRLTLLIRDGEIAQVAYPVFPPDGAAAQALELLAART